ncbi:MAG: alpha-ribazole phosphatase family protein [Gammaproteobacteria bacterium]|nr:alpha-ribazole phosphatase family protein [Gammaproteobacteria bacterium]MXW46691.1 alpha-ribazole phosphatase family protein [Gammaproteobacteria bacterium]MYD00969.1 alpha-ribazole phosphatase family protein [Gammaproteobacteria bacterium]MYI24521.1 alpha-ribazole phosphatase family protein [Gammaproteobacteria bacterium]
MGLILVRHTRLDVVPGLCYGQTDLDVADTFADEAAVVLSSLPEVRRVVSSPLRRCRALAQRIADSAGLPMDIDERFKEIDFGAWEGRPWAEVPKQEIDAWAEDFLYARPHGGESVAMLRNRVGAALADWSALNEPIVIVTHAGVIRAARNEDRDPPGGFGDPIAFGGIVALPETGQDLTGGADHD